MNKTKIFSLIIFGVAVVFIVAMFSFAKKQPKIFIDSNPEEKEVVEKPCIVVNHNKVFLAVDEKYLLDDFDYVSSDSGIAIVSGKVVVGKSVGEVILTNGCSSYEIEVTDMITAPYLSEEKEQLPCGKYSIEENEYLDSVLASKIKNAGYQTRAGAVEAGRFLLLQFPYHMSYFSENGRLPFCDGEGRFSHKGLYLNKYKVEKENITAIVHGPAEWGCPIFSDPAGINQLNSLDCSGFVTWCLVNAGFEPGDLGAGLSSAYDYSDIGEKHDITKESLDEVKVGDLFAEDGHISILLGINDGTYYVGESNLGIDIRIRVSTKQELIDSDFYAWIDMDEFYNHSDGNLSNYWE